jgi:HD-like signal output (HDOD) protein
MEKHSVVHQNHSNYDMNCKDIDYKNIPVQSDIIAGIMRLDVESTTCFRDLDSYVHSDQGVATLVLRVVNSALYNRGNTISTIPRAISVLGFQVVRSLSMLAFSRSLFAQTRNPLFKTHIWEHSLLTALAAQSICNSMGHAKHQDEAFIAGLMHDMGKVLLFTHDETKYMQVLARIVDEGCRSAEAEQQFFGCDHYQVGQEAVGQWNLPSRFADYVGIDHTIVSLDRAADPALLSIALANRVIGSLGIGSRRLEPEERLAGLRSFGATEENCHSWLGDAFYASLINNDTYQLCANL